MTEQLSLWNTEPSTRLPPLRMVVYDIADPRRLHRVARHCEDYGVRIQKSVFQMEVEEEAWKRYWTDLEKLIHVEEDSVCMMPLCRSCRAKILTMGLDHQPKPVVCWVL